MEIGDTHKMWLTTGVCGGLHATP